MVDYFDYRFGRVSISLEKSYLTCFFSITISRSPIMPTDALIHA